ncbi:hypothetical protein HK097_011537, partial [Rhizophlyctis rosea]
MRVARSGSSNSIKGGMKERTVSSVGGGGSKTGTKVATMLKVGNGGTGAEGAGASFSTSSNRDAETRSTKVVHVDNGGSANTLRSAEDVVSSKRASLSMPKRKTLVPVLARAGRAETSVALK